MFVDLNLPKKFVKSHSSKAFRLALRQAQTEWRIWRRHRLAVAKVREYTKNLPLKLNLGCGRNPKAGWVNIDLLHADADLHLDLREPWPFPDESATHVYSEHVFEHFDIDREVPHFLSESLRILKAGGCFEVGVPDSAWLLQAYGNSDDYYWSFCKTIHPERYETQLDHINYHFRQDGEHKYAWDEETLARTLRRAGFASVGRREFDPAVDDESRRTGTLYLRAMKPQNGRA
jgi:predicted SAM-dependent methyltransferase